MKNELVFRPASKTAERLYINIHSLDTNTSMEAHAVHRDWTQRDSVLSQRLFGRALRDAHLILISQFIIQQLYERL